MRNGHQYRCKCHHRTIQYQELLLVLHQRIAPAARHLWKTIYTSDEDCQEGYSRAAQVVIEALAGCRIWLRLLELVWRCAQSLGPEQRICKVRSQ